MIINFCLQFQLILLILFLGTKFKVVVVVTCKEHTNYKILNYYYFFQFMNS